MMEVEGSVQIDFVFGQRQIVAKPVMVMSFSARLHSRLQYATVIDVHYVSVHVQVILVMEVIM